MTMQRKTFYGLGVLCLWLSCLYCPLDAASQPAKQEALTELMALARTLVVTALPEDDYIPKYEESPPDEGEENIQFFSNDYPYLKSKMGVILDFVNISTDNVQSKNIDERRLTRLYTHLPRNPFFGSFLEWSGKLQTGGDTRIPAQWYCVFEFGGSYQYYQGNLILCPIGLLTLEQVNHVIATLKARGSYTSKPLTQHEAAATRSFAAKVHGLEAARHPSPEVSTEYLIFEQAELGESKGAKIIITQEKPGQYALFLLMGDENFIREATVGKDKEE